MTDVSLGPLLISAIGPLYQILKRHFDVQNATLASRRALARELRDACVDWSTRLEHTFDKAIDLLASKGRNAARSEIERQQNDFSSMDYGALGERSEALAGLKADSRFLDFADSCENFYREAIRIKDMAYRTFDDDGQSVSLENGEIARVGRVWKRRVEEALERVRSEHHKVDRLLQQ